MANQTYRRSLTPAGGIEFVYAPPFEWDRDIGEETVDFRVPSGETSGDGEYQGNGTQGPRIIPIRGTIIASSATDLQDKLDVLFAAHPSGVDCVLRRQILSNPFGNGVILRDRYIRCRVSSRSAKSNGLAYATWTIQLRAAHPFYLDTNTQAPVVLTTPGSTPITAGGGEKCGLVLSLGVSGAGLVTVTPSGTAGIDSAFNFSFNAPSAGTYLVDMRAKTFTKSGVNMIAQITGNNSGFFFIPPTAINLVTTGPLTAGGSTATVRRAWANP